MHRLVFRGTLHGCVTGRDSWTTPPSTPSHTLRPGDPRDPLAAHARRAIHAFWLICAFPSIRRTIQFLRRCLAFSVAPAEQCLFYPTARTTHPCFRRSCPSRSGTLLNKYSPRGPSREPLFCCPLGGPRASAEKSRTDLHAAGRFALYLAPFGGCRSMPIRYGSHTWWYSPIPARSRGLQQHRHLDTPTPSVVRGILDASGDVLDMRQHLRP